MTSNVTIDMQSESVRSPNCPKNRQIQLTPEEITAWRECLRHSSVVIPALSCAAMGYGLWSMTRYRANAKYAALFCGITSMIATKIFNSEKCLMKVASMPNSTLRDRLMEAGYTVPIARQRLEYKGFEPMNVQTEIQSPAESSTEIVFDDYSPMNAFDSYSSINDSSDIQVSEDTDLTEPINLQKGVSYDELRQKNREEFYKKKQAAWYKPTSSSKEPSVTRGPAATDNPSPMQEKTKYGDVWN